jgi:uncharacterized protein YceK
MRRSRVLALALTVVSSALVLSGCTKPNPGVSVWAGTKSIHLQAQCWSADSAVALDINACSAVLDKADKAKTIPTLIVRPGSTMGISVDVKVAKNGWTAKLGSNTLTPTKVTRTYWRFTYPQLAGLPAKNQLVILAVGPTSSTYRGVWVFNTVETGVNGG